MISLYGVVIGIAVVCSLLLCEYAFNKISAQKDFWSVAFYCIFFGVIGARIWHVVTDWHLYADRPYQALYIHQGGVSILGALLAGVIGIVLYHILYKKPLYESVFWLDLAVLVVPIGQMIGRFGNYFNQELYGLPTNLPWALNIDVAHRLPGFENFETYHPLFLYEILVLMPFTILIWYFFFKRPKSFGKGWFFLSYLVWYGLGRFFLDFLRIDTSVLAIGEVNLGKNQLLLFVVWWSSLVVMGWLVFGKKSPKLKQK